MEQFLYRFRDITVYSPQIFGDGRTDGYAAYTFVAAKISCHNSAAHVLFIHCRSRDAICLYHVKANVLFKASNVHHSGRSSTELLLQVTPRSNEHRETEARQLTKSSLRDVSSPYVAVRNIGHLL